MYMHGLSMISLHPVVKFPLFWSINAYEFHIIVVENYIGVFYHAQSKQMNTCFFF